MGENADLKNSEYGCFSRSDNHVEKDYQVWTMCNKMIEHPGRWMKGTVVEKE